MAQTQAKSVVIGGENLTLREMPGVTFYAGEEVPVADTPVRGEKSLTRAQASRLLDTNRASTKSEKGGK